MNRKKRLKNIVEGFESEAELLLAQIDELEEKYMELHVAALSLKFAVIDEGAKPKYHRKVMFRHRTEWPYLWKRIDDLIKVLDKQ